MKKKHIFTFFLWGLGGMFTELYAAGNQQAITIPMSNITSYEIRPPLMQDVKTAAEVTANVNLYEMRLDEAANCALKNALENGKVSGALKEEREKEKETLK